MNDYSINDNQFKIIKHQSAIIGDFLYHYLAYKELSSILKTLNQKKTFWIYTSNAHLMQCFNHWCMVFGSYDTNQTHWKKLKFNIDKDTGGFLSILLKGLNMSENEWRVVWDDITGFRNSYTAHRDIVDDRGPVPYLDHAYKSVCIYYNWLVEKVYLATEVRMDCLEDFIEEHTESIRQTIQQI